MGDRDVLEGDVEFGGAAGEVRADAVGDGLTLSDELGGVELGDDGLEDFVADGGENTLIIVCSETLGSVSFTFPYTMVLEAKVDERGGGSPPGRSWAAPSPQAGEGPSASG